MTLTVPPEINPVDKWRHFLYNVFTVNEQERDMYGFSHRVSRSITSELLGNLEQGLYDKDRMILDLLCWMSESEVECFARANKYILDDEEDGE